MFDGAVTIDVVFADIEQNADGGIERGREVDLVGRHLDDVDAARARRLQRQDRGADIAAHLGVVAGNLCEMSDQRCRGRLAVGAGDRNERRVRRVAATFAAEQLDVADHLDTRLARFQHAPVRHRVGQRHAGREHERCEIAPGNAAQIRGDETGLRRLGDVVGIVVGGDHLGAAGLQRVAGGEPRAAEAEHRDRLAGEGCNRDHRGTVNAASAWRGRRAPASPR